MFIFGLPFMVGLSLTVPDCSRPKYEKYYVITFVMSISWISLISSYMVGDGLVGEAASSRRGERAREGGQSYCDSSRGQGVGLLCYQSGGVLVILRKNNARLCFLTDRKMALVLRGLGRADNEGHFFTSRCS